MVCFCFLVDQTKEVSKSKPAAGFCSRLLSALFAEPFSDLIAEYSWGRSATSIVFVPAFVFFPSAIRDG
ncbi:hypothetical protein V6N13_017660 [Hibiscus sabdariffa]